MEVSASGVTGPNAHEVAAVENNLGPDNVTNLFKKMVDLTVKVTRWKLESAIQNHAQVWIFFLRINLQKPLLKKAMMFVNLAKFNTEMVNAEN